MRDYICQNSLLVRMSGKHRVDIHEDPADGNLAGWVGKHRSIHEVKGYRLTCLCGWVEQANSDRDAMSRALRHEARPHR